MDEPTEQRTPAVAHAGEATAAPEATDYGYDDVDNLTSVRAPMGGAPNQPAGAFLTTIGYDAADQQTSVTRQQHTATATKQLVTRMAYDKRGNVIAVSDPKHSALAACASLTSDQLASTAACQRDQMSYDKVDNLLDSVQDPSGLDQDTAYSYFEDDSPETVTDPRALKAHPAGASYTTTYAYDERGQRTGVTDPVGDTTSWSYDLAGRTVKVTKPDGTATAAPGDYETVYTYDPDGYLTDMTIPRAAGQYGSASWAMHYVRDAVGDATTITDPRGHAFENTYFDTGELHTTQRPSFYAFSAPAAPDGTPQAGEGADVATTAGGAAEITPLSYDDLVAQADAPSDRLPSTSGETSFGAVAPLAVPGVLPRKGTATFEYDPEMRLTSVTNAHPTTNSLTRDALGRITSITQPLVTPPAGPSDQITRSWGYDRDGNVATFDSGDHDATGVEATTTYGYDQFDRMSSASIPGSSPSHASQTTQYGYDDNDNLTTTTTPLGHVTTVGYDAADRATSQLDATNRLTSYGYDAAGNRTTTITPRGMALAAGQRGPYTTTTNFNGADEPTDVSDGLGNMTTYAYDADANQTGVSAPGSASAPGGAITTRQITRTFDGRDLPWAETTDDGLGKSTSIRTSVTEFDADGDARRTVDPAGVDATTHLPRFADDGEAHIDPASDADRDATVREYDADGLLTYVDQPKGPPGATGNDDHLFRSDLQYTNAGFIATVSLPHDITAAQPALDTTYVHDENGWITSASDPAHLPAGSVTPTVQKLSYGYDHRGDQTSWTRDAQTGEPTRTITRTFATDGVLTERTATKGSSAERSYDYTYDADRRLLATKETDPSRPANTHETFTYDDADRLLTANDSARGTDTVMTYDSGGLVHTRQTDGTLLGTTYSGGKTTTLAYDSLDRQQQLDVDPSDGPNRSTTFDYWPSGDQRRSTDPDGVRHEDYYDAAGQLVDRQRVTAAGTVADQPYAYDINENRSSDEKGTETYNSRNQLVHWTRAASPGGSVDYVLNGAGAVTRTTDSAGPDTVNTLDGDRLTQATTTQGAASVTRDYSYDGFGNLLTIHQQGQPTSTDTTYVYDAFERLISSHAPPATATTTYTYDGLDRRDTKTESGSTTTYGYIASSNDLSQEATGATKRSYDYDANGERQGQQVIAPSTTTAYRTYVVDAQGSVQGLEDAGGAIEPGTAYTYDPYGDQTATTLNQAGQDNPFRFQGFYYDPTAGGYDALAREYRPDIQRFLTQDRYEAAGADLDLAENALTGDRYAFVAGNPTTNIENDGHIPGELADNGSLKADPSKAPAHRQNIGGFNVRIPASAPPTPAANARGVLQSEQAQHDQAYFDQAAAHPNDLPPCIPGSCTGDQADTFIRRYEIHHDDVQLGWGEQAFDFLRYGPSYAAKLSAEPQWSKSVTNALNEVGGIFASAGPLDIPADLTGFVSAIRDADELTDAAKAGRVAGDAEGFIGPVRESSDAIANGHAFGKHVIEQGEFPGITTSDQFAREIEGVVSNPTASKPLLRGRSAYYDEPSNTLVIRDPRSPDGGTAFRPSAGRRYYDGLR